MPHEYETTVYSGQDLKSARVRGQMKGWAQGAGATIVALLLLKLFGWIPAVLLLVLVVVAGFGIVRAVRKFGGPG